jgi:hypothetical protein
MDSTATMENVTAVPALTVDTSLPLSQPSVCIPRVFANIGWKRIKSTFEEAGWGTVEHVDMVMKSNDKGEEYKKVFVHFIEWKDMTVREQLLKDEEVQLTYNDPWFWKVRRSAVARPLANGVSDVAPPAPKAADARRHIASKGTPRQYDAPKQQYNRDAAPRQQQVAGGMDLAQVVAMQAQQIQMLTQLIGSGSFAGSGFAGAGMMPTYSAPMQRTQQSRPAPTKSLGQGYATPRDTYRTPKKHLDFDDAPSTPVKNPFIPTSVPGAPRKLQLRRKLDDAE